MSEDVPLDEFLGSEKTEEAADEESATEETSEETEDAGEAERTEDAEEAEQDAAEGAGPPNPAVSTYDWSPDGAACADCGETVERRWRDDGELVCGDCKEW